MEGRWGLRNLPSSNVAVEAVMRDVQQKHHRIENGTSTLDTQRAPGTSNLKCPYTSILYQGHACRISSSSRCCIYFPR